MAGKWPQQFQPASNPSFHAYQQQFSQHHQFIPQPNGPYPPPYSSNLQPAPLQHQSLPDQSSCYNCGSPDHWAQSCPEPRREVPVGEIHRQNFARPPKRQKPNAPIITKYPVPPHVQQSLAPQQFYGSAPYNHHAYQMHAGLHGPPTPVSAQSASQMQWQQPQHQGRYSQQYHQGAYYPQGNGYRDPYPTPVAQTPGPSPNSHNMSHLSPSQGPPFNQNFPQATHQHVQPYGFQGHTFTSTSPSSTVSLSNGYPLTQHHDVQGKFSQDVQGAQDLNHPLESYPEKPKTEPMETTNSPPEEDNLNALDIPDMPPSSISLTDETILAGRALFRLVKRPLPANFIVADALAPFESSKVEDQGRCESKYWVKGALGKLCQHVKDTVDRDDLLNDPIFLNIPDESEIIPIEELTSLYNPSQCDDSNEQAEEQPGEVFEESRSPQNGGETGDVMDSLEHALSEGRRKQPDSNSSSSKIPKDAVMPPKNTEELLASLGVTGAPKPVRAPARPYPPPSLEHHDHRSWSGSRSPSRHVSHDRRSRSNSGMKRESYDREGNDTSNQNSLYNNRYTAQDNAPVNRVIHASGELPYPQRLEQPPPPPHPLQKPSYLEGIGIRPLSAGQNLGNHPLFADHTLQNGTSYSKQSMDGASNSPTKTRLERFNGRKREYDHRDSSDESETPGRRQADDVTPKLKRRQPKVAEAYSRRW